MCKSVSFKNGCKGTAFWGHSQIKCTKSTKMCTLWSICAIKKYAKQAPIALLLHKINYPLLRQHAYEPL